MLKVTLLRSVPVTVASADQPEYQQALDTRYAARVLGNLQGAVDYCSACGRGCRSCREPYGRVFSDAVQVVDLPARLPYLLEDPAEFLPAEIPRHDVLLAIAIHEQILLQVLRQGKTWGTRAVVVPIEAPGWVSGAAREEAERICQDLGIEIAFPKPFCAFAPPAGSLLADFRQQFHIGAPEVTLAVEEEHITKAYVEISAACGATYHVARWLEGRSIHDNLEIEVISKRLHAFPCTASMAWDDEIGDTIMHVAGVAHKQILDPIQTPRSPEEKVEMMVSPHGTLIPRPPSAKENLDNIQHARSLIIQSLQKKEEVSLADLRALEGTTPAALHSALILLKREARVAVTGARIRRGERFVARGSAGDDLET